MLKLFEVRSTKNDEIKGSFENKMKAKELRDKLNGEKGEEFVISRGPDHPEGASGTRVIKRTESQKKRLKGGNAFFR